MPGKNVSKRFSDPSAVVTNSVLVQSEFLTQVAVGVRDNQFVMGNLLPDVGVRKDTDKILVVSPKGMFKPAERRAETALPEQAAVQFAEDSYSTDEFALEGWVSDDAIRNAIVQIDPLSREAEFLMKRILLTQEIGIINEIFGAVKVAGVNYYKILGATEKWNGGSASAPLSDFSLCISKIAARTGYRPNIASMSSDAYEAFIGNAQVTEILRNTSASQITDAMPVAQIRGLRLQFADGVVNEGSIDTPSYKNIQYDVNTSTQLFDTVVVSYVAPGDTLTLGHNFVSKPVISFQGRGLEGDRRQATLVYVAKKFGPKVTNVGAAHVIGKVLG